MLSTGHDWFDEGIRECADVVVSELRTVRDRTPFAFDRSLVNDELLNKTLIPRLQKAMAEHAGFELQYPVERLPSGTDDERRTIFAKLFSGNLLLFREGKIEVYGIAKVPGRQPEESSAEVSVKGPRDGFVEEIDVNIGLIRKRLKTPDLKIVRYTVGEENRADIALLYMQSAAKPEWVNEAKKRLEGVHAKAVVGAKQVEEMLADRSVALFPLIDYAGRPDSAVAALLNGQILFTMDGSPLVFLAPVNLLSLLRSPEDNYLPYYFVSLEKLIRIASLVTTIFLPGFWVAVSSFNIDQIPFPLLSTILMSRIGLPMSATIEMLLMLALFEVFREAGVRLPRAVGQTVAVVGGIIVGDAAIRAGLTSPTMLVISSLTAVSSFTLVNQSLAGAVTVVRLFVLLFCMTFGMFGFFVSFLIVLMYLASLRSFGVPYLQPLAPIRWRDLAYSFIRMPSVMSNGPYKPRPGERRR